MNKNLKLYYNQKIYRFGGGGCGGCGSSCSTTYDSKKAYAEAFKIWHREINSVFDQYSVAMDKLSSELSKSFKEENKKIETALIEEFSNLKIKLIELESLEEDNEEISKKKLWLDEIVKEINEILEI